MSHRRFVVGSVPYLNAIPLTRWLETEEGRNFAEVVYAPPSQLAQMLQARIIDVALVSTAEHFRRPDTVFVPGLAIASFGEVLSVRLFSKVPLSEIRSVALDTSSLTSSALVQILLRKVYGIEPTYCSLPPDLTMMLAECDSALLIGDKGMLAPSEGLIVLDLGAEWTRWTGLPFVWAVWLANPEADLDALSMLLHRAYEWGEVHLEQLIAQSAQQMNIPYALCERYLREVMVYRIDSRFLQGLERYRQEWTQLFSSE